MGDAVRLNDYDAGLVLPANFDREIRSGEKPLLELFVSGESLASNRLIIAVTTLDFVRDVEGTVPPVKVEVVDLGREALPLSLRLVPIIMMYALLVAGVFVPGSSLVDEKEKGTLSAVLVTPVRPSEVLLAKALLGTLLAFVMAAITLAMNRALGSRPLDLVLVLFVAAAVSATLGLVAGEFAKDSTVLFSIIKGTGWFLMAPVIFYLFPDWPQWIAKLFPMYWVIDPIWQIAVLNKSLADVWWEVLVAVGILVVLIPVVGLLSRRMVVKLASD
jgi:ABC-2 type transport system permease protein